MIRYTIKLAGRLVLLVAMLFALALLTAKVSGADELRQHHCNPYTYGRPHSCHVAPVQHVDGFGFYGFAKVSPWGTWDTTDLRKCVTIDGRLVCFRYGAPR